jgi:hypothetical protein
MIFVIIIIIIFLNRFMNMYNQLQKSQLVTEEDCKNAILMLRALSKQNPDDVEVYIYLLYLQEHVLIYWCEVSDQHILMESLTSDFNYAQQRFSDNAEYLFFVSRIMSTPEWFIGVNYNDFVILADQMLLKACQMDPSNTLFEWQHCRGERRTSLANLILSEKKSIVEWLYSKGIMGVKIVSHIKSTSRDYSTKRYSPNNFKHYYFPQ